MSLGVVQEKLKDLSARILKKLDLAKESIGVDESQLKITISCQCDFMIRGSEEKIREFQTTVIDQLESGLINNLL